MNGESNWRDALRALLESSLVCRCGAQNTALVRIIRVVDNHGQAHCQDCGSTGPVQDFRRAA